MMAQLQFFTTTAHSLAFTSSNECVTALSRGILNWCVYRGGLICFLPQIRVTIIRILTLHQLESHITLASSTQELCGLHTCSWSWVMGISDPISLGYPHMTPTGVIVIIILSSLQLISYCLAGHMALISRSWKINWEFLLLIWRIYFVHKKAFLFFVSFLADLTLQEELGLTPELFLWVSR